MTAAEIIEEIKHLPPEERAHIVDFVRGLDGRGPWTPQELSEAAARLTGLRDPATVSSLKQQIAAGFYGKTSGA